MLAAMTARGLSSGRLSRTLSGEIVRAEPGGKIVLSGSGGPPAEAPADRRPRDRGQLRGRCCLWRLRAVQAEQPQCMGPVRVSVVSQSPPNASDCPLIMFNSDQILID